MSLILVYVPSHLSYWNPTKPDILRLHSSWNPRSGPSQRNTTLNRYTTNPFSVTLLSASTPYPSVNTYHHPNLSQVMYCDYPPEIRSVHIPATPPCTKHQSRKNWFIHKLGPLKLSKVESTFLIPTPQHTVSLYTFIIVSRINVYGLGGVYSFAPSGISGYNW